MRIRKSSTPEPIHDEIYRTLQILPKIMEPVKTWAPALVTIVNQYHRN